MNKFEQVWTSFDQFGSSLNQFDPIWSNLIQFDPICHNKRVRLAIWFVKFGFIVWELVVGSDEQDMYLLDKAGIKSLYYIYSYVIFYFAFWCFSRKLGINLKFRGGGRHLGCRFWWQIVLVSNKDFAECCCVSRADIQIARQVCILHWVIAPA